MTETKALLILLTGGLEALPWREQRRQRTASGNLGTWEVSRGAHK